VIPLLNDAASMLGEYYDPIRIAPLAVYHSALLFMPCCALYMAACNDLLDIRLLTPREPAWTSDALVFQRGRSRVYLYISVSPDDALVAAVDESCTQVEVWKTSTGQLLNTWFSYNSKTLPYVLATSFSLDGKVLAIITQEAVHWWEPHADICRIQSIDLKAPSVRVFPGSVPSHSVISSCGAFLAVGYSQEEILLQVVDLNTGRARTFLRDLLIASVAVSQDASRIASSLYDIEHRINLRVWNAHDGTLLWNRRGDFSVALAFTQRHNIITVTRGGAVLMHSANGGDMAIELAKLSVDATEQIDRRWYHARMISASRLFPLVAIATSEAVSVWNEDTKQLVACRQLYVNPSEEKYPNFRPVTRVAFTESDRPGLIVASANEDMTLWNLQAQEAMDAPPCNLLGGAVNSVRFSHDGCFVISASDDSDLRVWETCSGVLKTTIPTGHTHPVTAAAFALRDKSLVLSGSEGGQDMELRKAESCELLQQFNTSLRIQITSQLMAFSRDGSQFVTMSLDSGPNILRLYESNTGHVLAEERESEHEIFTAIMFLPDGSRVIAVSESSDSTKSWSTLTQPPLRDPRTTALHKQSREAFGLFAYSPDCTRMVSSSSNCEIQLWDASTGEKLQTASASDFALLEVETRTSHLLSRLNFLQYSPTMQGRFLSCSWAGVVRIWNDHTLDIERTITAINLHPGSLLWPGSTVTACYSPDGAKIVVAAEHSLRRGSGQRYEIRVHDVNTGHAIQILAPIISHTAHEDPVSCDPHSFARSMSLSFSPDGQHLFFLGSGRPRVEVMSVLNGEHIGSLDSPLRTAFTAFSICPITARLFVTCQPKSIAHRITEAAEVSVELVAQSGLAGADATAMCVSIVQDLFEANQTYLCVWDTQGFQLQSTLRCGRNGFQPPHFCIDRDLHSLLRQPLSRHHTVAAVRQIPRLHRPKFVLDSDGWLIFSPDGPSSRYCCAEDTEYEDLVINVCKLPGNRRPPPSALRRHEPWGPVAAHGHVVAVGSLRGSVSILDLTSLMLKLEGSRLGAVMEEAK
jgi:WD40 repeat protein